MLESTAPSPSAQDLALLDSTVWSLTRSRRMRREDAEDFRQTVHLKLVERGYDVFQRFDGRSSLRTYLLVVVHRLLLDWQNHHFGKWRPSVPARRLGPAAVRLDRLIDRDGYSVDEAISCARSAGEPLSVDELHRLAEALPTRRRRQLLGTEVAELARQIPFEDPIERRQNAKVAVRMHTLLRRQLERLPSEERRLLALRYRRGMTVRVMADHLRLDQKALYRRFDRLLVSLRRQLPAQELQPRSLGPIKNGAHDRRRRRTETGPPTGTPPAGQESPRAPIREDRPIGPR